jgi:hypothetical protein
LHRSDPYRCPHLTRHEAIPKVDGALMFPAMLVGPKPWL